jgi:transposase
MSNIVLGIDVSKLTFDVALLFEHKLKTKKFDNKNKGFEELVNWLKAKNLTKPLHICMEATGYYSEDLATYLFNAGYVVSVVNPAQIKGFGQSELIRNKTDQADAQMIARFCHSMNPQPWQPKPEHVRTLQGLVRRVEALQNMYQQESNRLETTSCEYLQVSLKEMMKRIAEEIKAIKKKIKEEIDKNPDLRTKHDLLESIPGVGEATIAQILAFMGNVEDFKNAKQLAAFVGLNPKQYQSGTSINRRSRISKMGNTNLRKSLYMPAISAKRFNPIVKAFCENLKSAGKPTMLIICAAMRKLVHIIFGVLKSGQPFSVEFA